MAASVSVSLAARGGPRTSATTVAVAPFQLTVDSIMKGPDLVGYPPSGLRWSGDSQRLFFEWRRPGEEETATWAVNADGTSLTNLSDAARKLAPPAAAGRWDRARRRVVFVDRGDIAVVDTIAGQRTQITRTSETEANPRWARDDTHVTLTRGGNLFIVPISASAEAAHAALVIGRSTIRSPDSPIR